MPARVRLGPAGNCLTASEKGTPASLRRVSELGLSAQEIEFVRAVYLTRAAARDVGELARSLGIELSVHASYFVNLCGDAATLQASQRRILEAADRAAAMGSRIVVFHPGYYGRLTPAQASAAVERACRELRRQLPGDVLLGLETTGRKSQFGSLEELVALCPRLDGAVPVIDWAHIYARQGGTIDYGAVLDALKPLKLRHLHTHFTGVAFTDKGERHHLTIDARRPDFAPLAREIIRRSLDITLISESPVLERDAVAMKQILERAGHKF